LQVMRDGRRVTVEVTSDGAGLVSHAGAALVALVADRVGLTKALSLRLAAIKQRRRGHDPGRVIRDLAVMLVDGGECVSDLGAVREQDPLFGSVASDSTAFRVVDRIASEPGPLDAVRVAHARARARFWELDGAPERLTIDVDATLITAHSEKEKAAGNYKGGYGFHPLQVYLDETREALGGLLRPGNAGSNTADDHKAVLDLALAQIPTEYVESLEILVRADSAGATHGLLDYCREANMRFSVGYELTDSVRQAILEILDDAWVAALDQDGSVEGVDRSEPGVAGSGTVAPVVFEMGQERADQRRVEIIDVQLERLLAGLLAGEAQQQPERVAVGADRFRAGVALGDQTLSEERLEGGCERGHESTSPICPRRWLMCSSGSGTASKYQNVLAGSTCPRYVLSSGIRRSMSSSAAYQSSRV
jgi:hypothetical protein